MIYFLMKLGHKTNTMRLTALFLLWSLHFNIIAQDFDIVILNGKLIDGSGNPWRHADIGVTNGKISAIGNLKGATARIRIDASNKIVSPGFIDVHTHIEGNDLKYPMASNFVMDGVTTVITGNCGSSNTDMLSYQFKLDSVKMAVNVASLVGHNSVRRAVMGESQRDPTADEQIKMESLVEVAMSNGAVGLSTGLIYVPGTYSKTAEVIGLAKVVSKYNGVYASHIRDEGDHVTEAIEEAINIGRQAAIPVEISHFKVTYKPNWGRSVNTLNQVKEARKQGIDVTIDQYPYIASSTTLNTTLPSWAFSGGKDSLLLRLSYPETRNKIKSQMVATLKQKKLKDYSYAVVARYGADSTLNGKNISEINTLKGRKAKPSLEAETILEMVENGSAQMIFFSMAENDLRTIMQYPYNMFASDAGIVRFGSGVPHPRAYGTNSRVLGTYVRDAGILTWEEAIRRMTSLPAQKFNLRDRGMLRESMAADIIVFDPATITDKSTFTQPHAYAQGFEYVIVNGALVVREGKYTGLRNGIFLKGVSAANPVLRAPAGAQ
jgi:N-acyl-D-amino-acid deacylase